MKEKVDIEDPVGLGIKIAIGFLIAIVGIPIAFLILLMILGMFLQ